MLDEMVIQGTEAALGPVAPGANAGLEYLRLRLHLRRMAGPAAVPGPGVGKRLRRSDRDRGRWSGLSATMVRRCLGKALIETLCPFGEPLCQPVPRRGVPAPEPEGLCELAGSCAYGVCFAGSSSRRPPFALYVPRSRKRPRVELTLYGPGCRFYPWLLQGLKRALSRGLGRARVRWQIDQVWQVAAGGRGERVCSSDLAGMLPALAVDRFQLAEGDYVAPRPIEVRLLSPTRLIRDGKLLRGRELVSFEVVIGRILDRFEGLYGSGASPLLETSARAALEIAASRVSVVVDDTRWVEVHDYSARQCSELKFGGKVGRVIYGEGAARFMPILRVGEILQVGKNPTSGCGRIAVRARKR